MELTDFTKTELDTLLEAVEAWEKGDFGVDMMVDLMGNMFTKENTEARMKHEAETKTRREKTEVAKKMRKERGIMLKAKLLKVRDGIEAASV